MWFDSHAHITSLDQDAIDLVLLRAKVSRVDWIMNICTCIDELERAKKLRDKYPHLFIAGATTPHDVEKQGDEFALFEKAAKSKEMSAIGETGLDYHYEHSPKKQQLEYLLKYIDLSLQCQLPLIIHCREAFSDLLSILDQNYLEKKGSTNVILHCFTGTEKEARALMERGIFLSFSGIVTFNKSQSLQEVAKITLPELLLIETDTPYLAPVPKRGKPNEPSFLPFIGECIAKLKEQPVQEIAKITTSNAKRIFGVE